MSEMKGIDPSVPHGQEKGMFSLYLQLLKIINVIAVRRFFQSKLDEDSLKRRGLYTNK